MGDKCLGRSTMTKTKRSGKKLKISTETVRRLGTETLKKVTGGATDGYGPRGASDDCTTDDTCGRG